MAQSVIRTVFASMKAIESNMRSHPEKFRKKNGRKIVPQFRSPLLDLVRGRDYSLLWNKEHTGKVFSLNTLRGRIKVPFRSDAMDWAFADGTKMGTAKLVFRKGKFYLHIPVTVEVPDPPDPCDITDVVGIDRGIRFLAVSHDGKKTSFVSGAEVKQKRAHYRKLRQSLQKKQTSSARRRLRAIGHRENRWMNDVNHCLSKALVSQYPQGTLFVLEDLTGIRSASERVRVKDRYVQVSWPYYDLEQKLTYKAQMNGSAVIRVDPRYTSQTCPICGYRDKNNRDQKDHVFRCRECGYTTNDDRAAAMNLQRMGMEYVLRAQVS
jgi:IS605 OrfB family transposase